MTTRFTCYFVATIISTLTLHGQPTTPYITYEGPPFTQTNISPKHMEDAQVARESRPAKLDPDGNWGAVVDGFQVGIRLERSSFTNGEPVRARILIRNVSDRLSTYLVWSERDPDYDVALTENGRPIPRRDDTGLNSNISERLRATRNGSTYHCPSPPGTQRAFTIDLSKVFALEPNGRYEVCAKRTIVNWKGNALTNLSSAKATFKVTAP
jgi:hypothetical protein